MKCVHVKNLIQPTGMADYKALDISKIFPGSAIYPPDKNEAYLLYEGEVDNSRDITVIDQIDYDAEVARLTNLPKPVTEADRIAELEETMAILLMGGAGGV